MWLAFKAFFSSNVAKITEILAAVATGTAVVIGIFRQGQKSEKNAEMQRVNKEGAAAHEIEDKNRANLADGDAAGKLQSDWSR